MLGGKMTDDQVLIVDDNALTRELLSLQLRDLDCVTVSAGDGYAALEMLSTMPITAVLLDLNMPGLGGIEVLRAMNGKKQDVPVVIVSGLSSGDVVRQTLREGAFDYLTKPLHFDELRLVVGRALEHGRLLRKNREYQDQLELRVRDRTVALEDALSGISETYQETILALGSALETRDVETQHHALRVAQYSEVISSAMGIHDEPMLQNIRWGAFLHDIGKIGVPDTILKKPGPLTESEWEVMKTHPEIGRRIVANIPFLKGSVPIIYCHHERFDGAGYPRGLHGQTIPVEARVFSIADALDAMLSDRPYKAAMAFTEARNVLISESGKQFDPEITAILAGIPEQRWSEGAALLETQSSQR
jgi:cyclic di-GMP phosphodiesterase